MRIPVTYKGYDFIAIADGAGLDVEAPGFGEYDAVMNIASELWHKIYAKRVEIFGNDAELHDTTNGELFASLDDLGLLSRN